MKPEPMARLVWQGADTIAAIDDLLERTDRIEIALPADYNHVLYRVFHPGAADHALEDLDIRGDAEVLRRMSGVRGLEEFARLIDRLAAADASVQILSPPRVLIDLPAGTRP